MSQITGPHAVETPSRPESGAAPPFAATLARRGLSLKRLETTTLQVNVGLLCNQVCKHCHLDAGPHRTEVMSVETADQVASFAERSAFQVIDVTGGAPELNPSLDRMIERFVGLAPRVMVRCNLTALLAKGPDFARRVFADRGVAIVASMPSTNQGQVEAQRGPRVYADSVEALKTLNALGYGVEGSGLELNLVSNPAGAFLPASQAQAEAKFRQDLGRRWGIVFNNLFALANVPLGRFKAWLKDRGTYDDYMRRLAAAFNPCALDGVMCRSLISVSWDGFLYDCDFHLAKGVPAGGTRPTHVSDCDGPPAPGSPISTADHCYACAAGAGFT